MIVLYNWFIAFFFFFFDKNSESNEQLNSNFGFKSIKGPPENENFNVLKTTCAIWYENLNSRM